MCVLKKKTPEEATCGFIFILFWTTPPPHPIVPSVANFLVRVFGPLSIPTFASTHNSFQDFLARNVCNTPLTIVYSHLRFYTVHSSRYLSFLGPALKSSPRVVL